MSATASRTATLLAELVAHPTHNPGGDELGLAARLERELADRGADEVRRVEVPRAPTPGAWVLARWGTPRTLVNAHIDTVPVNAGWTADPYTARFSDEEGGRITALGACDTKGAIAAILTALDEERPRDLAVLFSGDEEHGAGCMRHFIASGAARGIERAVVCEPSGCRLGTRHRGILSLGLRRTGEGGHSSRADTMAAPLAELARVATALDDWARARRTAGPPGFVGTCLNIARFDGGVAFNVVPSEATLLASLRPAPGVDARALRAELEALVERTAPGTEVNWKVDNPAFATRDLGAFARLLPTAAAAGPVDLAYWTEAALLSEAGVDAVVYGPGDIARAHAPDEWVSVADLETARAAFARLFAASRDGHVEGTP